MMGILIKKLKQARFFQYILSIIFLIPSSAFATWSFEAATGGAYQFPMPLTIRQSGYPDIHMTAHYDTRPFSPPPYYVLRLGKWTENQAWEAQMIHHKLYMNNTTDEVPRFMVTNGYNLLTVNHAWLTKKDFIWRVGAGFVLAHPESTIRGQKFSETGGTLNDGGYYVAGPTGMIGIEKRFYFKKSFYFELESELTASYAHVKVANGNADVPDVAIHGGIGLGYDYR